MTTEEKAKKYDEAIKVIKDNLDALNEITETGANVVNIQSIRNCFYRAFPELKESEDEKMIGRIIKALQRYMPTDELLEEQEMVAWLEKQGNEPKKVSIWKHWKNGIAGGAEGEQIYLIKSGLTYSISSCLGFECDYIELSELDNLLHPSHSCQDITELGRCYIDGMNTANKVEPKFHKGDWVVTDKNNVVQIKTIENGKYVLENTMRFSVDYVDKCWKEWEISDAKDGDVLLSKHNQPFIYNGIFDEECVGAYCGIDKFGDDFLEDTFSCDWSCKEGVKPATKEQRDTLFAKMRDVGYEWDAKKKEVRKMEQKSKWTEEDECHMGECISAIATKDSWSFEEKRRTKHWLKSLKERIGE